MTAEDAPGDGLLLLTAEETQSLLYLGWWKEEGFTDDWPEQAEADIDAIMETGRRRADETAHAETNRLLGDYRDLLENRIAGLSFAQPPGSEAAAEYARRVDEDTRQRDAILAVLAETGSPVETTTTATDSEKSEHGRQ